MRLKKGSRDRNSGGLDRAPISELGFIDDFSSLATEANATTIISLNTPLFTLIHLRLCSARRSNALDDAAGDRLGAAR